MLLYKNRNTFLQGLHPLAAVILISLYLIMIIVLNNPIYISIAAISILFLAYIDGCLKEVLRYGMLIVPFALLIIILNPLMVKNGETVIYNGKINFPLIGAMRITREALLYGIMSGIRIVYITIVFGFGNLIIHPDRTFGYFSKYIKKSALLMSMTIRLFPTIMTSFENILQVEKLRGNNMEQKGIKNKMKGAGNIVNILFLSSLEDASDMAESMHSRGYGALNKRSSYFKEKLSIYDKMVILFAGSEFIYLRYFIAKGYNKFDFYPKVDNPINLLSTHGLVLCLLLFIPFIINWGWKMWSK